MAAPLRTALVCGPGEGGWDEPTRSKRWRELGFLHVPRPEEATRQHAALCARLEEAGVEVVSLPADPVLTLDAVYTHDASFMTDRGAVLLRPGKQNRREEPARHAALYRSLGVPVLGRLTAPACAEAGDLVWIDERTLLAGRGYRTNAGGVATLRELLGPLGVEVVEAPLAHGRGPEVCLHLMSIVSVLDERVLLVDLELMAVITIELLRERGYRFVEIDPGERDGLACNVLALGERRLLAIEENARTNARLRESGFDVRTFPGSELCWNGGGGPTCLTRPILRGGTAV